MKRPIGSIVGWLTLVAFAAVGAFALRSGTLAMFRASYSATIFVLAFAGTAAWAGRHRSGGFWAGFAAFGSAYFLMAIQHRGTAVGDSPPALVNHAMILASRVDEAAKQFSLWIAPEDFVKMDPESYYFWDGGGQLRVLQHRILTIHCLLAGWLGVIGGAVGLGLSGRDVAAPR